MPGPGQIVVRNRAVAINPVDRYKAQMGKLMFGWIKYPAVFGYDLAGEVATIGASVTRFKVGDRVVGTALGMDKSHDASEGAFQLFTVVQAHMAAPIPDAMSFEVACVIPLGICTAASGLFGADQLALNPPSANPKDQGKTVLIWGGSTSVGSNAIQLAKAAGFRVVTTASPANFALVTGLGAAEVFDHRSATVVVGVVQALKSHTLAGALARGEGSAAACAKVLGQSSGAKKVALATFPLDIDGLPERPGFGAALTQVVPKMVAAGAGLWLGFRRAGVKFSVIFGTKLADTDLSRVIFEEFLPQVLQTGNFVAAPRPLVVGHGLEFIQPAFDRHRQGVSARKVVVTL